MGELVVGRPALQVKTAVSLPLDLVSIMSLLYRAVPGSGLDPWLVAARRSLTPQLQADLDLLHGFSGRLLYFMEEPIMRFEPLRDDRLDATFDDLITFLDALPVDEYHHMLLRALERAHQDLGTTLAPPPDDDETSWRRYLEPGLTTASADDVLALVRDSSQLKVRTTRLLRGVWGGLYEREYLASHELLLQAERLARGAASRGFGMAFVELTGNRLPAPLAAGLAHVAQAVFCPSAHLGSFVSYISYPPHLIIFFAAQSVAGMRDVTTASELPFVAEEDLAPVDAIGGEDLLESLRALGDANRLRILDLLGGGELYAQEIVGRLGIAQSAVSRHLSQLERAGLVRVEPRRGMKYYAIDRGRMESLAESIRARAH